ncbi:MAG TPA: hypothetical protein VLH09_11190, partial [Bryobacteraceae bacterium]|nr:hypothetical protein [Bryobacteraceae bacterium]
GYSAMSVSRQSHGSLLSRYVLNYPAHAATLSWMGNLPGRVIGRVRAGATKRVGGDPYAVVDVYIARTGRRVRPFVHLTNLTGAAYEEIAGVPMPGRGIMGGVEWIPWGPPN